MKKEKRYIDIIVRLGRINDAKRRGLIGELEALEAERFQYTRLRLNGNEAGKSTIRSIDKKIKEITKR